MGDRGKESRRAIREAHFLVEDLLATCAQRWPHTPPEKSCRFVLEETMASELTEEALKTAGVVLKGGGNRRKGPKLFRASVELPLLNKKSTAKFTTEKWWLAHAEAKNAVAEVALLALRSMKNNTDT
ncbi:unnamed protein product [Phytomonas sp. Hart1]|nr:unnamed protein product [Phytomonas sp. Hart1]|eukprot:CCW72197.1 unnamed protein product [Phytomonas sp. isolate Hart1]